MISCLMVTQARKREFAKQAIRHFDWQTFAERELVVVHDSGSAFHEELINYSKQFPHAVIHIHHITEQLSLGELRNHSVRLANFPIICQWDDDDLYHPDRIRTQFELLTAEGSDFCFFTDQLHWYIDKNWFFWDNWALEDFPMNLIQGTVLGKKDLLPEYPAMARGEDTPVIMNIANQGCKISKLEGKGYLYIYTFNGQNAWEMKHHAAVSAWKRFELEYLLEHKEVLAKHLAEYQFEFDSITLPHDKGEYQLNFNES